MNHDRLAVRPNQGEQVHADGDETAEDLLATLMVRHELPLFRFLYLQLGDADAATDCAQDTFMRAFEQLRRGAPVNAGWLYRVARNRAIDEHRRRRRQEPALARLALTGGHAVSPEQGAVMREAFAGLEPDDRVVLYLLAVEGFSAADIAGMLGIKTGTARMRIHRARERFRLAYGGTT
ncbi:MAG TPA: sigma-70 family RNA polymerase sigma factor [Chloroflexota bacterium]|nr:sigma-70 family RNA polymerase sigma factor [Chloroflexota bacterium]